MKKFLKQIGILLMTEIILGCQSKPNSDSKEGQKANKENKVTLAFNQDPVGNLNPHEYLPSQFITQDMVYDGLVSYGENGEIKPMLAESWTISEDGKTYTFKLRPNVKFSDGSAFDAKNVVKNFDTIFSKENKSKHSWFAFTNHLKSYRAVDDLTFEIVLDTPYTATLYDLAMIRPIRFLGDAGFPEGGDTMKGIKAPIGTGAWVLKEHKNNEYAVFVRNEYYWGEKPAASEIIIKNIPDSETLALQFESGDIDLIYGNGLISLDRFNSYRQDNGKYTTATSNPMSIRMLLMNTTSSILGDLNVRKALNHAVDKESIAKNIFDGIEKPADTIFAPNVPHTNVKLEKYGYDLAKAEAMLDEAGWKKGADGIREKNGKKMVLSFPYISSKVTDKKYRRVHSGRMEKNWYTG